MEEDCLLSFALSCCFRSRVGDGLVGVIADAGESSSFITVQIESNQKRRASYKPAETREKKGEGEKEKN